MALGSRQLIRQFSSTSSLLALPNIQKPRVPWTERRILNAMTVPLLPPDTRPLPVKCHDKMLEKKKQKNTEVKFCFFLSYFFIVNQLHYSSIFKMISLINATSSLVLFL